MYLDYKISQWPFKRGITSQGEIIQTLQKNMRQLIFDEESIYEMSINFWWGIHIWNFKTILINFERTQGQMHGQAQAIYPFNFSKIGGIKKERGILFNLCFAFFSDFIRKFSKNTVHLLFGKALIFLFI